MSEVVTGSQGSLPFLSKGLGVSEVVTGSQGSLPFLSEGLGVSELVTGISWYPESTSLLLMLVLLTPTLLLIE